VIICQCAVVSDRSVTEVVAAGARTLAHVCRATNAGRDCGSCVRSVRRVITEHLDRGVGQTARIPCAVVDFATH
jgi:bacterioferritin-associated ferredoxin